MYEILSKSKGEKEVWQYLSLADYQGIVVHGTNWPLFEKRYDFEGKGKKADKVNWIGRLCKIRQTTHHPEKGLISKDDVIFVKDIHDRVREKIAGAFQSEAN